LEARLLLQRVEPFVKRIGASIAPFFLAPASARPLGVLRILVSAVLLLQAVFVAPLIFELYGKSGITQDALTRYLSDPLLPRIGWFLPLLEGWGVPERQVILGTCLAYAVCLLSLFFGWRTRVAAFFCWLLHWILMTSGYCTNYGVDTFAHIVLFYFMWMPVGGAYSVEQWLRGNPSTTSFEARVSLRVLQIHLCFVYLAGGVEKALGPQWWNGEVIWRALMLPVYAQFDMSWIAGVPWVAKVAAWGTLLTEIGYSFFIWPRKTRPLWITLTVSLHVGIAVFLGLGVFGLIMSVLTLAVFGVSAEPRREEARDRVTLFGGCTVQVPGGTVA